MATKTAKKTDDKPKSEAKPRAKRRAAKITYTQAKQLSARAASTASGTERLAAELEKYVEAFGDSANPVASSLRSAHEAVVAAKISLDEAQLRIGDAEETIATFFG